MSSSRGKWTSNMGFLLAAIGSAVGLGNIWRFPYVIYENGGGAFLIPYLIAIFTAGIPLLLLEFGLGHKFRTSTPLTFKKIHPKFELIGWLPCISAGVIILYYSSILSWALIYTKNAFSIAWGDDAEGFFFNTFLGLTESPLILGSIQWPILMGNVIIWFFAWLICCKNIKGIETANKILLPLLLLLILFIGFQGLRLPGAIEGLNQLFTPKWDALLSATVWLEAYGHIFFSLSLAMGIMITFSSYLPEKCEINNSAMITGFSNSSFEIVCAVVIFSILGFMAGQQNVPVDEVVSAGVGLSFVVFPAGIASMPPGVAIIVGVLFFGSLVVAGITSLVSLIEAASAPCIDKFGFERSKFITMFCIGAFILSSIFTTGAGLYVLDIVDKFVNSFAIVGLGFLEVLIIGWYFGPEKIREHSNSISYYRIGKWWDICIKYVLPIILGVTLTRGIIEMIASGYGGYSTADLMIYGVLVLGLMFIMALVLSSRKPASEDTIEMEK